MRRLVNITGTQSLVLLIALTVAAQTGLSGSQTAGREATSSGGGPAAADGIVPFRIQVPAPALSDLKTRLQRAWFADEFPDVGWDYGTNLSYLQSLVAYWRDKYDWRAQERRLNRFDQFKTKIGGLDIHFVHQRSAESNATPLLLLNGWPSSIVEYDKVIEPLSNPAAHGGRASDAFHVVVPSMPGYGFSDKPRERGFNPERMAQIWATLMARLGYSRYVVHGSDWGVSVATWLALNDAAHVSALHLAGCPGAMVGQATRPAGSPPPPVSANLGYQEIQTTKPQTLGQGLSDSPLGLASWIIDKWHSWSDHDGDLEKVYSKDELLTNVMIYWVTNSGTSSARLYYETRHVDGQLQPTFFGTFMPPITKGRVTVPTGCGSFPSQFDNRGLTINRDPAVARKNAESRYNVVHQTIAAKGGHFPALEQPQAWMEDLRTFTRGQTGR